MLDRERPGVYSKQGGKRPRLDRRETSRASACRALHQRPLGQYGWCLRSVRHPTRRQRAWQLPRLAARHAVSAVGRAAPAGARTLFEQRLLPLASGVDAALVACSGCTRSARSRRRARSSTVLSTASASRCAASTRRLAQLFLAARRRLPTRSRSGNARRRARRRCRFTASGRRTRRRPRKCSSTAATSSIRRAARCSTTTRSRSRGRMALAARADFCARSTERADVARLDEGRGRRARARLPEHHSGSSSSSTASAAEWRRK